MTGLISPAVRAARRVAVAAVESPASAYGVVDAIVFALDSAQLLQSPETAAELATLRKRVAELEAELRIGAPWTCLVCGKETRRDVCPVCESHREDAAAGGGERS